jgi:hypothetical protein
VVQSSLAYSIRRWFCFFQRLAELTLVLLLALASTFVNLIFGWVVFVWRQSEVEGKLRTGPLPFSPVIKASKEL